MARIERTKNAARKYLLWHVSKNLQHCDPLYYAHGYDLSHGCAVSGTEQSVWIHFVCAESCRIGRGLSDGL